MNIVFRLIPALVAGAVVYVGGIQGQADSALAGILAGVAVVVSLLIVFVDRIFKKVDGELLFLTATGVFLGLASGFFLRQLTAAWGVTSPAAASFIFAVPVVFFGYVGMQFGRYPGLRILGGARGGAEGKEPGGSTEKILDTSVIIDGRILDIVQTNFIEGPFIIPNFVLREIQLISDSPDPIKRNRGRRGLEMLNLLQQNDTVKVKISYADYTDTREVDAKLVKLARETGGKLVTNDFNLNKVAELQGVEVLNLNNLTNALKPVVLPGEDILIDIIKEGKDENQGIGYLEDGTMVVVENGGGLVGKSTRVNVTSIIQTAAGKMIFTRASSDETSGERDDRSRRRDGGRGGRQFNQGGGGGNQRDRQDRGPRPEGGGGGDQQPRDNRYDGDDREAMRGNRRR